MGNRLPDPTPTSPHRPRRPARAARSGALAALLAAALLGPGCASEPELFRPPAPRDLLTDTSDDGSLLDGLSHPDPEVRRVAVLALARLPADDRLGALLAASQTEVKDDVVAAMCFAVGQWGDPSSWSFLVEKAQHEDAAVRAAAVTGLGRMGDDSLTPRVVQALDDPVPAVRQAAALALHRLDARRYDHRRRATEGQLKTRDAALAQAALQDDDLGVRWRAAYTLSELPERPGLATVLGRCARDESSALSRLFALRGLGALHARGGTDALPVARRSLLDEDARVEVEAARILGRHGLLEESLALTADPSAQVRMVALDGMRRRVIGAERPFDQDLAPEVRVHLRRHFEERIAADPSPMVRRELRATLAVLGARQPEDERHIVRDPETGEPLDVVGQALGDPAADLAASGENALLELETSEDRRDRARAARLLADGDLEDPALLERLLADPVPDVVGTALGTFAGLDAVGMTHVRGHLIEALEHEDPAIRGSAASVAAPLVSAGEAPPWLVGAVSQALEDSKSYELEEARAQLAGALDLPTLDPVPPETTPTAPLLDRLLAERRRAQQDPTPEVLLETTRGDVRLVLDRVTAPRHVESFLELCETGYYDGLDFHRVVPNFVVQGLDPRHDGWGVAGRRVPDEFSARPYLTGTVGMPHAGSPHTGGCQIFITHLPTPHLDGGYTVFGRVEEGLDVVAALEIGDQVLSARRTDLDPDA